MTTGATSEFDRLERRCLGLGVAALLLSTGGAFLNPARFFQAYLLGYLFWVGIALGCLALLMIHHLAGGRWGFVIQRPLEAGVRTLPLLALLFLPILFGLKDLYLWARPEAVAAEALLRHKQLYLNAPAFLFRAVVYFAVWIGAGAILTMLSGRRDQGIDTLPLTRRMQVLSGPGLLLYGATASFAAIDWGMSLEPMWFSSIYGVVFIVGQGLAALAFVIVTVVLLSDRPPLRDAITPQQFHDLGNFLLAFVMLWAYIAFSQFLIIWSGNLPEEIPWYLHRMRGGWGFLAALLIAFHFIVPFLLLLSRSTKRRAKVLILVAAGILGMRLLDLFWLTSPAFHPGGLDLHWMDLSVPVGLGGIWLAAYLELLKRRPLLPEHDPRFAAAAESAHGASA
jgi:hypothetical protein